MNQVRNGTNQQRNQINQQDLSADNENVQKFPKYFSSFYG